MWGWRRVLIRSDSSSVVEAFSRNSLPWFARVHWHTVCSKYDSVRFEHTYREANFYVDKMAKRGCLLNEEVGTSFEGRPDFLTCIELPNVSYYRFK